MTQPQIGSFESIALAAISPSTTNPRKNFDQAKLDELTDSIRTSGVQQPIIIRPNGRERVASFLIAWHLDLRTL